MSLLKSLRGERWPGKDKMSQSESGRVLREVGSRRKLAVKATRARLGPGLPLGPTSRDAAGLG